MNPANFIELYQRVKKSDGFSSLHIKKIRDLTVIQLFDQMSLILSCDFDGAIGEKPNDIVKISNYLIGRFAARVTLMEMICCGAAPVAVVDTLSVELNPTGKKIIAGVFDKMKEAGLSRRKCLPEVQKTIFQHHKQE